MATSPTTFHIQAHRGASVDLLENTLPSIELAVRQGVDSVEFDVHLTDQNHWIVFHDFELSSKHFDPSFSKVPKLTRHLTLEELRTFQLNSSSHPKLQHLRTEPYFIPTLDVVLKKQIELSNQLSRTVVFDIEIKSDPRNPHYSRAPNELAIELYNFLSKHGSQEGSVRLRSFDPNVLIALRRLDTSLTLTAITQQADDLDLLSQMLDTIQPNYWAPSCLNLNVDHIRRARDLKLEVIPWTVNSLEEARKLRQWGAWGVTTDNPKLLIGHTGIDPLALTNASYEN